MAGDKDTETPVLHVIVVGFHHKKGCQVEFSYPPVIAGQPVDSHELPEEWKHLPSLALPDGAHNYQKDTVFFHLPSRDASRKTVYCVSCYRQMDAKDLINRTADITRSTVQKSVCVISRLPLYGLLKAKLELITHAYFDERDFSKVELLEQTFNNLNASLSESLSTQIFLGLSPREAILRFKHKLLVLFKLLLLERRVLFFGSPVETLGSTMLTVLSLYPGMLEFGLEQSVSNGGQRLVSPTMGVASIAQRDGGTGEEFVEVRYHESSPEPAPVNPPATSSSSLSLSSSEPPESPTIPRDISFEAHPPAASDAGSSAKVKKEMENRRRRTSGEQGWAAQAAASQLEIHTAGQHSNSNSNSSANNSHHHHHHDKSKNGGVGVHSKPRSSAPHPLSSQDSGGGGSGGDGETSAAGHAARSSGNNNNKQSPLGVKEEDLSSLTAKTGHVLTNNNAAAATAAVVDDLVKQTEGSASSSSTTITTCEGPEEGLSELRLSVAGVAGRDPLLLGRSDSVEELDSPESISKIDREDCFSWEDGPLHLTLDMDSSEGHPLGKGQGSVDASPRRVEQDSSSQDRSLPSDTDTHSSDNSSSLASTPRGTSPAKTVSAAATPGAATSGQEDKKKKASSSSPARRTGGVLKSKLTTALGKVRSKGKDPGGVEMKPIVRGDVSLQQDPFGFPLAIFTEGCVCHPYLSLQFHSMLNDINVRSFVLGATNILFRQQKQVTDVVVEIQDGKLEVKDRELAKQLNLTTADLRFAEVLVRVVTEEKSNMYLDGTEWEGSDEWIRAQFRNYLLTLLATMQTEDGKLLDDFGLPFISVWRTTHNYRHWLETLPHPNIADVPAGHPCTGNLSVTDVRMKLNHSMQSTERGRKINAAVVQTGKYVAQTGRAVGGAFSSARSAVSSWFTSIANDWRHEEEEEEGGREEEEEEEEQGGKEEEKRENGAVADKPLSS